MQGVAMSRTTGGGKLAITFRRSNISGHQRWERRGNPIRVVVEGYSTRVQRGENQGGSQKGFRKGSISGIPRGTQEDTWRGFGGAHGGSPQGRLTGVPQGWSPTKVEKQTSHMASPREVA
jgi:hypothetical protein